jgi:drug/metabolite transporter (DMT)-like permease
VLSLIVYALVMIVPINWLWLWSAKHLPPSRVSLIFSLEAVVGIITAALLAGEPFGWREALGSLLVVGSTVIDVLGHRLPAPAHGHS